MSPRFVEIVGVGSLWWSDVGLWRWASVGSWWWASVGSWCGSARWVRGGELVLVRGVGWLGGFMVVGRCGSSLCGWVVWIGGFSGGVGCCWISDCDRWLWWWFHHYSM